MRRSLAIYTGVLAYSLAIACAATANAATPYKPATDLRPVAGIEDAQTIGGQWEATLAADTKALACAVHASPTAKAELVASAECSSAGVYKAGAKNECAILDYTSPSGRVRGMLYYAQLRGKDPKPAKLYYFDGIVWIQVERPRVCG